MANRKRNADPRAGLVRQKATRVGLGLVVVFAILQTGSSAARSENAAMEKSAGAPTSAAALDPTTCESRSADLREQSEGDALPAAGARAGRSNFWGPPRVVIAVVELNAPNMYHEWFHAGGTNYPSKAPDSVNEAVLSEFGIDSDHILRLSRTGDAVADLEADAAQFDAVEYGVPYWYEGTNVIGVSFAPQGKRLRSEVNPFAAFVPAHATGVVAAALQANPEAVVVAIQADNAKPLTATKEELNGAIPAELSKPLGEKWAFNHDAIDFVSTSYGSRYNAPYGGDLVDGYKGVVGCGKMHFSAPDNPQRGYTPITGSNSSGPWWTVAVGGYYEGTDGRPSLDENGNESRAAGTGQLIDIVADFSQSLPFCVLCTSGVRERAEGTSFATSRAAGTLSSVVLEARRTTKHKGGVHLSEEGPPLMVEGRGHALTVWQLRRAMEEAAYYPTEDVSEPRTWDSIPGAPWLTHGWGAVTPDLNRGFVAEALAQLGISGVARAPKPAEACAFQTAGIRLRQEYWNRVAPFSGSSGQYGDPFGENPFRYCDHSSEISGTGGQGSATSDTQVDEAGAAGVGMPVPVMDAIY